MPTLSVGTTRNSQRGVTLIEMLVVMALIALVVSLSAPSVSAGLDTLRLRGASDSIVGFLNSALSRADARQQAVEIVISPAAGTLMARSSDGRFEKRLEIESPIKIQSVLPSLADGMQGGTRRFLLYPGGAAPKIAIEVANDKGRTRTVSVDPITGVPHAR